MFIGIDIDKKCGIFAATTDAENFEKGRTKLQDLPALIQRFKPTAIGLEYTGRLAEPWIGIAIEEGTPIYIIHSTERKAINRIQRQKAKTDPRDAIAIAQSLWIWCDLQRRANALLPTDLFTDASSVRIAWTLRAILASVDKLTEQRAAAAAVGDSPDIERLWLSQAKTDLPEQALEGAVAYCRKHFPTELPALMALPGVGERLATYAIATLLPIERFKSVKQVVGYVGLNCVQHNSGGRDLHRPYTPWLGQKEFRGMLYITAMSQCDKDTEPGKFYRHLRARGKPHGQALTAVAHKQLRAIFAVLCRGSSREQIEQDAAAAAAAPPPSYITQVAFARAHNITRQAVADRIKHNSLQTAIHNGRKYIVEETLADRARSSIAKLDSAG